jgi:hypothetical protein
VRYFINYPLVLNIKNYKGTEFFAIARSSIDSIASTNLPHGEIRSEYIVWHNSKMSRMCWNVYNSARNVTYSSDDSFAMEGVRL